MISIKSGFTTLNFILVMLFIYSDMVENNKNDNRIKLLKIHRKGIKIFLEISSLEEQLRINEETLYEHKLVEGIILTPSQLDLLQKESEYIICENEAVRLLSIREHSTRELQLKLKRKKFTNEIIEKIIEEMKSQGHLDDFRLAHNLAEILVRRKPSGRSYLCAFLQKKYFDRYMSERVAEIVLAETDEEKQAEHALKQKIRQYSKFELETAQRKAYNYLARRGFGYHAAKKAVDKLLNNENEVEKN